MKRDAWRRENEKTGLIAGSDTYDTYRLGNLYPLLQGRNPRFHQGQVLRHV